MAASQVPLALNSDGSEAALLSPDNRLHVFALGAAPRVLSEKAHLSKGYACCSWCPAPGSTLVAVGTAAGLVVIWDVARGEVAARLGATAAAEAPVSGQKRPHAGIGKGGAASAAVSRHNTAVRCLVWSADGTHLYSGAEGSAAIIRWHVATAAVSAVFAGDRRGHGALALSPRGGFLLAAATDILVIDVSPSSASAPAASSAASSASAAKAGRHNPPRGAAVVARLAGQSLPISAIAVAASTCPAGGDSDGGGGGDGDGFVVVSAAAGERSLCAWDCSGLALQEWAAQAAAAASTSGADAADADAIVSTQPSRVLLHPSTPAPHLQGSGAGGLSALAAPGKRGLVFVSCVGEDGALPIWRLKAARGRAAAAAAGGAAAAAGSDGEEVGGEAGKGAARPVKMSTRVVAAGDAPGGGEGAAVPVLAGMMVAAAGAAPVLATLAGSASAPKFFRAAYLDARGKRLALEQTVTLRVPSNASASAGAVAEAKGGRVKGSKGKAADVTSDAAAFDGVAAAPYERSASSAAASSSSVAAAPLAVPAAMPGASGPGEHVASALASGLRSVRLAAEPPATHRQESASSAAATASLEAGLGLRTSAAAASATPAAAAGKAAAAPEAEDAAEAAGSSGDGGVEDDADGPSLGQRIANVVNILRAPLLAPAPLTSSSSSSSSSSQQQQQHATAAASAVTHVSAAQAIASTGALTTVLQQALHSGDDAGLELVLERGGDATIVGNTLRALPLRYLLPLLEKLVGRLALRPHRSHHLLPWVRAAVSTHAGYLLSLPDLADRLSGLYTFLDSRLAPFKKLAKLQGRLELVLAQVQRTPGGGDEAAAPRAAGGSGSSSTGRDARKFKRAVKRARLVVAQADIQAVAASAVAAAASRSLAAAASAGKAPRRRHSSAAATLAAHEDDDGASEGQEGEGEPLDDAAEEDDESEEDESEEEEEEVIPTSKRPRRLLTASARKAMIVESGSSDGDGDGSEGAEEETAQTGAADADADSASEEGAEEGGDGSEEASEPPSDDDDDDEDYTDE